MISARGVAKKRRTQELAGVTVKCSLSVAVKQQSWRNGNHSADRIGCADPSSTRRLSLDRVQFLPASRHRQALNRLEARPFAPRDFRFIDRERQSGPALEQGFQCASAFN